MIRVEVKVRQDNLFDIYVIAENGEHLLNSNQGYENVEDAERIARKCFGAGGSDVNVDLHHKADEVMLRVQHRDGQWKSEQIR